LTLLCKFDMGIPIKRISQLLRILTLHSSELQLGGLGMKCSRVFCIAAVLSVFLISLGPFSGQAYEDTQCFICHTSAKKLIEITREIAKTRPAVTSTETEGEG
jgi:hypothetical protein